MSEPVKTLELSEELAEIAVNLKGKDGKVKEYILRELTGDALEGYMEENKKNVTVVVDGGKLVPTGVKTFKGIHLSLLKRCLWEKTTNNLVSEDFINGLPTRAQQTLFKEAQELNALSEKAEKDVSGN